jgi:hypothetical protein
MVKPGVALILPNDVDIVSYVEFEVLNTANVGCDNPQLLLEQQL